MTRILPRQFFIGSADLALSALVGAGDAYLAHHSRLVKTVESIQETCATLRDSLVAPTDFERQRQRVEAAETAWQTLDPDSFRNLRGEMPRRALEG